MGMNDTEKMAGLAMLGIPMGIAGGVVGKSLYDATRPDPRQQRIDRAKQRRADKFAKRMGQQVPKSGIMSMLGRVAGPAGAVAGALMPTQMGDATLTQQDIQDEVLRRRMFAGDPQAEGSGITSGLAEVAQETQTLDQSIDAAEDYAGVMNALRGDDKSVAERRTELAGIVGKKDATSTPESVLTLIQPTLNIMEMAEENTPAGGINMQAPGQQEAMARMAQGEQPVMRAEGTGQGGEKIGTEISGLDTVKALQQLVPTAQGYDSYLQQYQQLMGDGKTGYELNPYIAGLNLAAAVANAPKGGLLGAVLDPNTIKSVSDPILQMAQARSKNEQAIKLKALQASTAAKQAEASAKAGILDKAIPELMKGDQFQAYAAGNDTIVLNKRTGAYETITGDVEYDSVTLGDGRVALVNKSDRNDVTYLGEKKGENIFDVKPVTGGALVTNKQTGNVTFKPLDNMPVDFQVYGNAERGFFKMDAKGNITSLDETQTGVETGPAATEFMREIEQLNTARAKLNGMIEQGTSTTDPEFIRTKEQVNLLAGRLTPVKGSAFERLLDTKAEMVYNQTAGTEQEKQAAKETYMAKALDQYITAQNTVKQNYNPNEALDKEFAGLFGKQITAIQEGAGQANKLADMANMAVAASNGFSTGAFAETRLNILKMADAVGGRDLLRNTLGEDTFNSFFNAEGNDIPSGELLRSVGAQFAVMMAESFPGNLNQSEVDLIKAAGPNLAVSPEGLVTLQKVFTAASDRAQAEANYATNFLQENQGAGLGAEAKYAQFNKGLQQVRAENPVVTQEVLEALGSNTVEETSGFTVSDGSGTRSLNANQQKIFNAVKDASDKNSFIANWPTFIQANPAFSDNDPAKLWDNFSKLTRVQQ